MSPKKDTPRPGAMKVRWIARGLSTTDSTHWTAGLSDVDGRRFAVEVPAAAVESEEKFRAAVSAELGKPVELAYPLLQADGSPWVGPWDKEDVGLSVTVGRGRRRRTVSFAVTAPGTAVEGTLAERAARRYRLTALTPGREDSSPWTVRLQGDWDGTSHTVAIPPSAVRSQEAFEEEIRSRLGDCGIDYGTSAGAAAAAVALPWSARPPGRPPWVAGPDAGEAGGPDAGFGRGGYLSAEARAAALDLTPLGRAARVHRHRAG
jgi:hypothetical protein